MTLNEDEWKRKFEFELSVNAFGEMRRLLRKKGGEALSDLKNVDMLEAAAWGRKSRLERSIAEGADPNAFNGRALENAAFAGRTECVRVLLDHGADARANESLAVCFAAIRGDADIVRMLVAAGADPKTRNHSALPDAIGSG
ncbi:ankyrin repeat domain-containing protein, partial [Acidiferrobacter sp.]|uniref:ankyrin repeat domain-containing protein n=1 Tax=Acidiferrobacter sp. TaxID=1872107 RepID=UPI002620F107